jgi:hypothetical protein
MNYSPPAVETQEPIGTPFVLGPTYTISPTWTDEAQQEA